jgi:hypothetical protein
MIGPQGTSMCRRSICVHRIPYNSGQFFFMTFCMIFYDFFSIICSFLKNFNSTKIQYYKCAAWLQSSFCLLPLQPHITGMPSWLIDQAASTTHLLVAVVLLPAATTDTKNRHAPWLIDQATSTSSSSTTTLKY